MRRVSALESTWDRRGRDARAGPESVASGRLFCLSLAPRALPRRAAARISASVPCFSPCDALPHSPRYVVWRPLGTTFAALACLTNPQLSTRVCSWSPSTTWRLRVRWHLEITMRQVSALESTWERRGRVARPGPESMASGRLFCLSLAPRALPQRAAARILIFVLCFVACVALPHSPRYDGGRPSGPHSQLSPASLTPSSRLGVVPGRIPQLGVSACAGIWRSRCARFPRWNRLATDVAATRGQAQSPWLQAVFSASLSLHAHSRSALLR
jgi:hypothetical protein